MRPIYVFILIHNWFLTEKSNTNKTKSKRCFILCVEEKKGDSTYVHADGVYYYYCSTLPEEPLYFTLFHIIQLPHYCYISLCILSLLTSQRILNLHNNSAP